VRYKPFGALKWTSLELSPFFDGFGTYLPCGDISNAGTVRFYVLVEDSTGAVIANQGTLRDPIAVEVMSHGRGEPATLPGARPPAACLQEAFPEGWNLEN
jgi:hypothetical protein